MNSLSTPLRFALSLAAAGTLAALSGACGSHTTLPPTKDLTIAHEVEFLFEDMEPDTPYGTTVGMDNFKREADYQRLASELVCGGLDLGKSYLEIEDGPAAPTALHFQLYVSEAGASAGPDGEVGTADDTDAGMKLLAEFDRSMKARDRFSLSEANTVFEEGESFLRQMALSEQPAYDLRVVGDSLQAVPKVLTLAHLEFFFSNREGNCP